MVVPKVDNRVIGNPLSISALVVGVGAAISIMTEP